MPMINLQCPHCTMERMTFDIAGWRYFAGPPNDGIRRFSIVAFCRRCTNGVSLRAQLNARSPSLRGGYDERIWALPDDITPMLEFEFMWPEPPSPTAPFYTPASVERVFLEAEDNRLRNNLESAGAMYRKALDLATKHLDPTLASLMLAGRLKKLAASGRLTASISDWADRIRILGNEAAHGEDVMTEAEILDLGNLTRMALVYLFEMPERVRLMRKEVEPDGG